MYQVFFILVLRVFSVLSVKSENYSIPNKPVVSAKNWYVILFQVDSIYIQISPKKPEQVQRREVTGSVQSLKPADLRSAADEPPRKSRKQKLDKWQ